MEIKAFPYNDFPSNERNRLNRLMLSAWRDTDTENLHPKEMNAVSFCAEEDEEFIAYVGIISWKIKVCRTNFNLCGLSSVCTHPLHRRKGIGTQLVKEATTWILQNSAFDIGLFTCSPQNVDFYRNIGNWEECADLILKGNNWQKALNSKDMNLHVFKLLISPHAQSHADYFRNTTIVLNFPMGKFI